MKRAIAFSLFCLAILSSQQSAAQTNKVVVIPLGADAVPAEVIFTETSNMDSVVSFVNELGASPGDFLRQTFNTTKAGRLSVSMLASLGVSCTPNNSIPRYYYLLLDDVPIKSSVVVAVDGARISYRLEGITEAVIPKGTHDVTVGAECSGDNTRDFISFLAASNASILVIPE